MLKNQICIENVNNPYKKKNETIAFFERNGFKLKTEYDNRLVFQRGNIFQNFFVFDPLKWKSLIVVAFEEKSITINSTISTIGQTVMESEKHVWKVFFENYEDLITQNDYDEDIDNVVLDFAHKIRKNEYRNKIIWLIIGLLVSGIISFIVKLIIKRIITN